MRHLAWLALAAALLPAAGQAAERALVCRSIDGQVRVEFAGARVIGVTLRVPAMGSREARVWQMGPAEYAFELISESGETPYPEGCDGVASGTVAIVRTEHLSTRVVRLTLPGGAFPPGIAGRSADGDALERELTCTRVTTAMETCP